MGTQGFSAEDWLTYGRGQRDLKRVYEDFYSFIDPPAKSRHT